MGFGFCNSGNGGGGGSPAVPPIDPASLVFRPGGVAGGVVYTDWSLLMAAYASLVALGVTPDIVFDDSITSPIVLPAGTYSFAKDQVFKGLSLNQDHPVELPEGVVFEPTEHMRLEGGLDFIGTNTATPIIDLVNADDQLFIILDDGATITSNGTAPFVQSAVQLPSGGLFGVGMREGGQLLGSGTFFEDVTTAAQSGVFFAVMFTEASLDCALVTMTAASAAVLQIHEGSAIVTNKSALAPAVILEENDGNEIPFVADLAAGPATVTILAGESGLYPCDRTGGAVTYNLPPCDDVPKGFTVTIKCIDAGGGPLLTITPAGADQIDNLGGGLAGNGANFSARLVSDGVSRWYWVGRTF